jgi:hypothetical protein
MTRIVSLARTTSLAAMVCLAILALPSAAGADLQSDANALRSSLGLSQLGPADQAAADVARQMSNVVESPMRPALANCDCKLTAPGGMSTTPIGLYAQTTNQSDAVRNGKAPASFWGLDIGASLTDELQRYPTLLAGVLDPRATGLAAVSGSQRVGLAITVDASLPFGPPFLTPGNQYVFWSWQDSEPRLYQRQGGRWRKLGSIFAFSDPGQVPLPYTGALVAADVEMLPLTGKVALDPNGEEVTLYRDQTYRIVGDQGTTAPFQGTNRAARRPTR